MSRYGLKSGTESGLVVDLPTHNTHNTHSTHPAISSWHRPHSCVSSFRSHPHMPFHEAPDKQIISSFCRLGKHEIITGNKLTNKTSLSLSLVRDPSPAPPWRTISSPMISVALGATLSWQREGDLLPHHIAIPVRRLHRRMHQVLSQW